jgi:hypothetical protein
VSPALLGAAISAALSHIVFIHGARSVANWGMTPAGNLASTRGG